MQFLKNLFGFGEDKKSDGVRKLTHPRDLRKGDIIKFRFLNNPEISGKQFEVSIINTYLYGQICYPELVLKDSSGNILYLMTEEEDGEEYLAISKKIKKIEISEVIAPNDLIVAQAQGTGAKISIAEKPENLENWLVDTYKKVDHNVKGSFIKGDARYLSDAEINMRENFSSHLLEDSEGEHALELEVYESGEMEMCVTSYYDIKEIDEMWPAQSNLENI